MPFCLYAGPSRGVKIRGQPLLQPRLDPFPVDQLVEHSEHLLAEVIDPLDALAEIAIGLIVDPENSDLQQLEQEIWSMQLDLPPESETDNREESDRLIQIHLLAAEEFQKQDDFALALDEVARAYVIDPMNPEIKKAEVRIRQNQARQSPSNVQSLKLVYPNGRAAGGSR